MIGVSEFCKQPFLRTESVHTIAPFWGIKSVALTFYSTPRTVANVLLDGQEAILEKDASVYSFSFRNYPLRLHVHPYFIKYNSLVYPTICN